MTGPINAGMGLARRLASQGHNVSYMGIADCEPAVTANGFAFTTVYAEWFPRGWLDKFYLNFQAANEFDSDRDIVAFVKHLLNGGDKEISAQVKTLNIDLLIISASEFDSIFWALLAFKAKVKTLYLYDVLGGAANNTVPPIYTQLISNGTWWATVKIIWAWQYHKFMTKLSELRLALNAVDYLSTQKIKQLAAYCGYPVSEIRFVTDMPSPQLNLPQLALFPKQFDFPEVNRKGRFYGDASIDLNRKQVGFPWHRLRAKTPLTYTALSTLPLLKTSDCKKFFQTVIDTSLQWPEWDWVIAIGKALGVDEFENIPANVILVNQAPQLELLKKASLMITHGGPSSVKECIYFGVPMIVFPLWFDQHGNVARIIYHGLGTSGNFETVDTETLRNLIGETTNNHRYIENLKKLQTIFHEQEKLGLSVAIVEKLITDR